MPPHVVRSNGEEECSIYAMLLQPLEEIGHTFAGPPICINVNAQADSKHVLTRLSI